MTVLALRTAAWAQTPAAVSSLPVGTPVTIVSDETVDPRVRPGSEFRAHMRDPIELGTTLVAVAGTPARLIVTGKDTAKDGTVNYHIAIINLNLGSAGTLPVQPTTPIVQRIATGTAIAAATLASIGYDEGKVRVAVPLPFNLSNEPPAAGYTPAPLRTAAPILNPRNTRPRRPTSAPSPGAPPSPAASASPGASASPAEPPSPPAASAPPSPSAAPSAVPT